MLLGRYDGARRWHWRQDDLGGGGSTATAEADAVAEETAGDVETEETETPDPDGEDQPEGEDVPDGEESTPPEARQPAKPAAKAAGTKVGPPSSIPYSRFKALVDEVNDLKTSLASATQPAQADALDLHLDKLPKGEEGSPERQTYEDAKALAPILKALRPALLPEFDQVRAITAGALQAIDRIRFEIDAMSEALIEKDESGRVIADRRPDALKHMDRLSKIRQEVFQRTGGKRLIRHADAFTELQEQIKEEANQARSNEATIRADERGRTTREIAGRKAASRSGAPRPAASVPRAATPGKRSFDDIRKAIESGQDFAISG